MWNRTSTCFASLLLVAGFLFATVPGRAAADPGDEDFKIRIKKKVAIECEEGEDCGKKILFIDGDGEIRHLEAGDENFVWVGEGHGGHHSHSFRGQPGTKAGFLGVMLAELSPELRTHFGVPDDVGVMVSKVIDDSPASRAGVRVGDIIAAVDGESVSSGSGLAEAIRRYEANETVSLEVWRDGQVQTLSAAIEARAPKGYHGRTIKIDCGDGEDCDFDFNHDFDFNFDYDFDFDCGDGEGCEIEIDCEDGDCNCRINGERADCKALHGLHDRD